MIFYLLIIWTLNTNRFQFHFHSLKKKQTIFIYHANQLMKYLRIIQYHGLDLGSYYEIESSRHNIWYVITNEMRWNGTGWAHHITSHRNVLDLSNTKIIFFCSFLIRLNWIHSVVRYIVSFSWFEITFKHF